MGALDNPFASGYCIDMSNAATQTHPDYPNDYVVLEEHRGIRAPKRAALRFGAVLGADRGVGSVVLRVSAGVYDMIADDHRAIRFTRSK